MYRIAVTTPLLATGAGLFFVSSRSSARHQWAPPHQLLAGDALLSLGGVRTGGEHVEICGWFLPLALCEKEDRHADFGG